MTLPDRPPPPGEPVSILIHGFGYSPTSRDDNPHETLFAPHRQRCTRRAISWPWHLGFTTPKGRGLAIGLGWEARGSIWQAWAEAGRVGAELGAVLADLADWAGRPVDLIGHSLGARVALAAVAAARPGSIGRVLLLAACEYRATALAAARSTAGRQAEFINVSSRENDIYDFMTERLIAPPRRGDVMLGSGFEGSLSHWLDLQIDKPEVLGALRQVGHRIAPPRLTICHWSGYLRPGMMPLYRHLLQRRAELPLGLLRVAVPQDCDPRWARLAPRLTWPRLPGPGPGRLA